MITLKNKKIGIMGGTFNPIHYGHLILAEEARIYCGLDMILFMPSGQSYMKNAEEIVANQFRLTMTGLAIEENKYFQLSTLETDRKGATYTYETLSILKNIYPECEFYFILGADNLFTIENWKHPQKIFDSCKIVAAVRGNKDIQSVEQKAEELSIKYKSDILLLPSRNIEISSTDIRKRLYEGKSIRYLVPDKVYQYIQDNKLYIEKISKSK